MALNLQVQQQQYWQAMIELKVAAEYIELHRDYLSRWVMTLGVLKSIASSVSIGAWLIWKEYQFLWAAIIAASQIAEALKEVFPFAKKYKAASELTSAYANFFISARHEWAVIVSGGYSPKQINDRLLELRKSLLEAEQKSFPEGLAKKTDLSRQAEERTKEFFSTNYPLSQSDPEMAQNATQK
jgi:hypothetical protein